MEIKESLGYTDFYRKLPSLLSRLFSILCTDSSIGEYSIPRLILMDFFKLSCAWENREIVLSIQVIISFYVQFNFTIIAESFALRTSVREFEFLALEDTGKQSK